MLVQGPIPELRIQLTTVLAVALPFALITVFLLRLVLVSLKREPTTGDSWLVGRMAVSLTPIQKTGKVQVGGEIWNAWSRTEISEGTPVRIVTVDGLNLEVQAESEDKV